MKKYGILFGLIISITSTSMAQINPNPRGTDMECVYLLLLKDFDTKREINAEVRKAAATLFQEKRCDDTLEDIRLEINEQLLNLP
ncbi:MAG: hypothetical protein KDD46_05340 [Bdellovibrionales bacterium]|nr:hypothetical protein [Bdellovibrionales bacterium]